LWNPATAKDMTAAAGLLLAATLQLANMPYFATASNYLTGDPGSACWKKTPGGASLEITCPGSTTISYVDFPPTGALSSATTYSVQYTLTVDETALTAAYNTTIVATAVSSGDLYTVPHANIHSCISHVGACTPFVANTPGLATHTAAETANLVSVVRRGANWAYTFTSDVKLAPATYVILAHGRFFDSAGAKYDIAYGTPATEVVAPEEGVAVNTGGLIAIGIGIGVAWITLTAPVLWLLTRIGTIVAWDLINEVMVESGLDAIELAAAVLIFSGLKDDLTTVQIVQLVLIGINVVNIIVLDLYGVYTVLKDSSDESLLHVEQFRRWHSIFSLFILISPLTGLEIDAYLASLETTDLICMIFLSLDIGFRIRAMMSFLRGKCRANEEVAKDTKDPQQKDFAETSAEDLIDTVPASNRECC